MSKPHFTIKNRFQKRRERYEDILTPDILSDVCRQITGLPEYTIEFDNAGYNKGRLATLVHDDFIYYISFSETEITSRNSSFQSFPTALVKFLEELNWNKKIFFYFLPAQGNVEPPYFIFMYRLMRTAGTVFLNCPRQLATSIKPFTSLEDIEASKSALRSSNLGNRSTYLTRNEIGTPQIYGKTYGANKYETALLCVAVSKLAEGKVELYEIAEGNLISLPKPVREAIAKLSDFRIIQSNQTIESQEYEKNDSLRSPTFIFNLLAKYGHKKCALCSCEIPELIQGAHIWPVAVIKQQAGMTQKKKLDAAIDGNNGIWLCSNHHRLFDVNLILINRSGRAKCVSELGEAHRKYIGDVTMKKQLNAIFLTPTFLEYLQRRNSLLDENLFNPIN